MIYRVFAYLFALLLFINTACGSKERVLAWGSFRVESPGVGESGLVLVTGSQTPRGIDSIHIEAFGKTFDLGGSDLAKLQGVVANSIQLSYEHGYTELGGRTIYVLVGTGFTSGASEGKVITVRESGEIRIDDNTKP
jgi:hypothetical protein